MWAAKVSRKIRKVTSILPPDKSSSSIQPPSSSARSMFPNGLPNFSSEALTARPYLSLRAVLYMRCSYAMPGAKSVLSRCFILNMPWFSRIRHVVFIAPMLLLFASPLSSQSRSTPPSSQTANQPPSSPLPQLVDILPSTGIHFEHLSSPEQKYIMESMSGGVALIDFDRDGWPDIYFTNAQSVDMARSGKKARSALYHNNHDGTFSDVTDKAGVGYPCWAMGAVVGDYNNDGWPDLLVTCFGGVVLFRNNGDGTFTDVTKQAGLGNDSQWATGAAFGDYDRDGWVDLFVSHYVDFHLDDLPAFGSRQTCKYRGVDVQCGPRGLKGSSSSLYHNNGDGTFTDVSKKSGIRDAPNAFGLTAVWSDFDDNGHLDLFLANDAGRN